MFGPRYSYRSESRFTPYAQIVFGGATRSLSRQLDVLTGANIPVFPVVNAAKPVSGGQHGDNGSSERYPNGLCHGGGWRP